MIGYAKKIEKVIQGRKSFEQKKKKPQLKFNPGLARHRRLNNWAQEYQN